MSDPCAAPGTRLPDLHLPPIDTGALRAYADASLDDNPVHADPGLATAAGLDGLPVQGMLIMAQFQTMVERWRGDLHIVRMETRFMRPLYAGDTMTVVGRVVQSDTQTAILRLVARNGAGSPVSIAGVHVTAS